MIIRLLCALLLAVPPAPKSDAGAPPVQTPPLPPPIKMAPPMPTVRPAPEPTAASCWMAGCQRKTTAFGYELTAECGAAAQPRRLQFDSADGKGDPIVACLCCPLYKMKTPPRVFEEGQ